MSPPRDWGPLGAPGEWLRHARSDLALARLGQQSGDILAGQICFHAQQAAEKALKAALLAEAIPFPLTHDLEILLQLARENRLELTAEFDDLAQLTPYAVAVRYPGYAHAVSIAEVEEAIRLAEQAVAWAAELLHDV